MTAERWRVVAANDAYEVSDLGRVRNRASGHVLRPQRCSKGYLKVHLGRGMQRLVHRLVAEAFHGAPPLGAHADHIDFDYTNNRAANLRWLPGHLNAGRQVRWGPRGWERVCDEEPPEDFRELDERERHELDEQLAASGW